MEKTNAMRILDKNKIQYEFYDYQNTGAISGIDVANALKQNPLQVFKTLVTIGKTGKYYVFMIPVEKELDLKKAANIVNEKYIEMIKSKDLLNITGYIHGGCSPLGMKKTFITTIDKTAESFEKIMFSAGKIGYQIKVSLTDFKSLMNPNFGEICT